MPDRPRPHRTQAHDEAYSSSGRPESADDAGSSMQELADQLEAAKALAAEHLASLQRTAADFANFKRRTAEDRERELGLASESLLRKLLAIVDDFDRALDAMPADLRGVAWIEGVGLLDRKLRALLESEGVTPIDVVGRAFDPREAEAVASVPGTGRPEGEIVAEVQRGYRVRDRVLRPALVAIAGDDPSGNTTSHIN